MDTCCAWSPTSSTPSGSSGSSCSAGMPTPKGIPKRPSATWCAPSTCGGVHRWPTPATCRAVQADLARLEELRAVAFEELAEAYLTLGDHGAAGELLAVAIDAFPLRERLTEQLVLTLYRSGRQAEALRAYADLVRRLDDQLGIEPSLALRRLEEDVLLQRSSLDWSPESREPPEVLERPEPPGRFIGRRPEARGVPRVAFEGAAAGERRLMLVAGHAGVGKSTLLGEISRARRGRRGDGAARAMRPRRDR